jgi:hypothetical protein
MCHARKESFLLRGQEVMSYAVTGKDDSWKLCKWRDRRMRIPIFVCCNTEKEQLGNPVLTTSGERVTKNKTSREVMTESSSESMRKLTYSFVEEGLRLMKVMPRVDSRDPSCGQTFLQKPQNVQRTSLTPVLRTKRIVNGLSTSSLSHPWMASIYYKGRFLCGGSIISNRVIVTAAHCVRHALVKKENFSFSLSSLVTSKYEVMIGSSKLADGTMHKVSRVYVHEKYHVKAIYSDIALLVTQQTMTFTEMVQPLCTPAPFMTSNNLIGMPVKMIGFGTYFFGELFE